MSTKSVNPFSLFPVIKEIEAIKVIAFSKAIAPQIPQIRDLPEGIEILNKENIEVVGMIVESNTIVIRIDGGKFAKVPGVTMITFLMGAGASNEEANEIVNSYPQLFIA